MSAGRILLVEDNPGDVLLAREAWSLVSPSQEIKVVTTGEQALAFLRSEGPFSGEQQPDLVIMDLNLPGMNGREVIGEIKADHRLNDIPIVILTTSSIDQDVCTTYDIPDAHYFVKPPQFLELVRIMHRVTEFLCDAK